MEYIQTDILTQYAEIDELSNFVGQTVHIRGSIYKIREMSEFAFVILKSKRKLLQCVYSKAFSLFSLSELSENMSIALSGEVAQDVRSHSGFELRMTSFECLSTPTDIPPVVINNKSVTASLETLLDFRPLTLRNHKEQAIFGLQAGICRGVRKFLDHHSFTEIHSPKIVFGGAEGGANIFKLDYFGREAYLTQSPQFYKQIMVGVFERVYEIAPVFRAEKHDTSRHINEYTSIDLEMGFINSFYDLMELESAMISELLQFIQEHYADEIDLLNVKLPIITDIPAITFTEAKEMLATAYKRESKDAEDFEPEEEKLICELIKKETGSEFVFITHYRSSKRPFYTLDTQEKPEITESFDLLFRGMEITTGGQRIHDYRQQVSKMKRLGMDTEAFGSYLMAHKCGLPPHGGFGFGLERFTAKLLAFQNVRRATLFPRDMNRLKP